MRGALPFAIGFAASLSLLTVADPETCAEAHDQAGVVSLNRLAGRNGRCGVMVSPSDGREVSRTFSFFNSGLLLVFNSLGPGPLSRTTGSRAYFLFPRREQPSFERMTTDDFSVRTASGAIAVIDSETGRLESINGTRFHEDPSVNARNQGGLEIESYDGVLLDCGWLLGEAPYSKRNRTSVFRDAAGRRCQVGNTEIFEYADGNPRLKFATDAELADFLDRRCRRHRFDTSPLRAAPAVPAGTADVPAAAGEAGAAR
jgi:hypothetical protein